MEEWKKVEGFENYSVSNFGNIRNDKFNRNLIPKLKKNGYYQVGLCKNNNRQFFTIHRLVGLHFLEKVEGKYEIDHIDRNKTNNHISNLRFATRSEQERNKNKRKNCSSIYKGVSFHKSRNKWRCQIMINKIKIHLGCFQNEIECAKRWNDYIIENKLEGYTLNTFD